MLPYNPFYHNSFVYFNFIYAHTVLKRQIPGRIPEFCINCHFEDLKWKKLCSSQQDIMDNRPVYKVTLKSGLDMTSKMTKYMILSMGSGVRGSVRGPFFTRHPKYGTVHCGLCDCKCLCQ